MIWYRKQNACVRWVGALIAICVTGAAATPHQWNGLCQRGFLEAPERSSEARFTAHIGGTRIWCRPTGISLVAVSHAGEHIQTQRIDLDFASAPTDVFPASQRPERYYIVDGRCQRELRSFDALRYIGVAPGIDIVLRWSPSGLKYDVHVAPGSDLSALRLVLRGGRIKQLDPTTGALRIESGTEEFLDAAPTAYQPTPEGTERPLSVEYTVFNDTTFGYRITEAFDPTLPLVIDPAIVWSTYVGGSQDDAANDLTTDAAGNIYVCGNSLSIDFPLRGASANRGRQNMVIAKFTAGGQHLWSTYFGGERDEVAKAIVWDGSSGLLFVGGWSSSPSVTLSSPYPNRAGGAFDAVVLSFTTDGAFAGGTFLGGSREELVNALALRRDGSLVAVGRTNSPDFPIAQALQPTIGGDNDVFVTVLAIPTLQVIWSTYYGGSAFDEAYGVTTSPSGSVFVTGVTVSNDFPTANAFQPQAPPLDNAFVLALSSSGRRLWSTYVGGSDYDLGNRITYWNTKLYLAGTSSSNDFPIAGDSIAQRAKSGFNDAFLACMSETGMLVWSTFWGGRSAESGFSVGVFSDGRVVLAGSTSSPDFPRRRSILWEPRGGDDVFVALFRDGQNLWSATFGGSNDDVLYAIALLPSGDIVGAGETRSRDFAPLVNAQYQPNPSPGNRSDCFLFRLCGFAPTVQTSTSNRTLCNGQRAELWASDSLDIATIEWNTGSTARRITITDAGAYWFTATSRSGCTVISDTVVFRTALAQPVTLDTISARRNLRICQGERIGFTLRLRYRTHAWLDSNGTILSTADTLWVTSSGTYQAVVEDSTGCILRSALHRVEVVARPTLRYLHVAPDGSSTPIATDTITACTGETVEVEIARPPGTVCTWSDGTTGCRRTLTSTATLVAQVTDTNGCTWMMRPLTIGFTQRQRSSLQSRDSVCVGVPFTVGAQPASGTVIWDVPPELELLQASNDSTQRTFRAQRPGIYHLAAWIAAPCSDTAAITIVVTDQPTVAITATAVRLCPGQQSTLTAPSGFLEYRWNGTIGDTMFIASDTGWYRLEVSTRSGCTAKDSLYIGRWQPIATAPSALDFGTVALGGIAQRTAVLRNPADTAQEVKLQLARGTAFRIREPGTLMLQLDADSEGTVLIEFAPTAEGETTDTLIITALYPCAETLRVALRGIGMQSNRPVPITFAIKDVTISPTQSVVSIPLYAWSSSGDAQQIDSLILELSYNPTMLLPVRIVPGSITRLPPRSGRGWLQAAIPLDSMPTVAHTFPIALLQANVLIGDREADSITIEYATTPRRELQYGPVAGAIRYEGLCTAGGVRLIGHTGGERLSIAPNPSDGEASIFIAPIVNGPVHVQLICSDGRILWETVFAGKAGRHVALALPSLPSGSYTVVAVSQSGTATARAVIVR
ncbi:MAG: hypothetical protein KatS3mg040_0722 [Candidatus Kapaibacterium sp.]|nr:MAG: hypothetical protein KatS3mg040_0722 [Candidatus Kapabacteria bacterium]